MSESTSVIVYSPEEIRILFNKFAAEDDDEEDEDSDDNSDFMIEDNLDIIIDKVEDKILKLIRQRSCKRSLDVSSNCIAKRKKSKSK